MKAIERYTGFLYQEIHDLTNAIVSGSITNLLIISALFGILHPLDMIPDYELMMTDVGPEGEAIHKFWCQAFARNNLPAILKQYAPDAQRIFCFMNESSYMPAIEQLASNFAVYAVRVKNGGTSLSPKMWGMGVRSCLQKQAELSEEVEHVLGEGYALRRLPGRDA
jgi:cytoplasmic iron level regulating protein YaaA (DUF328/UPF0246 family)